MQPPPHIRMLGNNMVSDIIETFPWSALITHNIQTFEVM